MILDKIVNEKSCSLKEMSEISIEGLKQRVSRPTHKTIGFLQCIKKDK